MKITLKELKSLITECVQEAMEEAGGPDWKWHFSKVWVDLDEAGRHLPPEKQADFLDVKNALLKLVRGSEKKEF